MPSNTLALGLYDGRILKGFSAHHKLLRGRKKTSIKRRQLLQQLRRSGVSQVLGKNVVARTKNFISHTHTHTGRLSSVGRGGLEGLKPPQYFARGGRAPPIIKKFCMALTEPTAFLALQRSCQAMLIIAKAMQHQAFKIRGSQPLK